MLARAAPARPAHWPIDGVAFRQAIESYLSARVDPAIAQRLLLATNEIVTNILRHSRPSAEHIDISFVTHHGTMFCIVCDDGGHFTRFNEVWARCAPRPGAPPVFMSDCVGLHMVRALWPQSFYLRAEDGFNYFILPLTMAGMERLPDFFCPAELLTSDNRLHMWQSLITPLMMESSRC